MTLVLIAAGAVARYLVESAVPDRFSGAFPLGILVVSAALNLGGSVLIGMLAVVGGLWLGLSMG